MPAVATGGWEHSQQWHSHDSRPRFQYAQPQPRPPSPPTEAPIPPRNETDMNREMLIMVLTHFSTLIPSRFNGLPVRLVVHGGACMLLHTGLYNLAQKQHHLSNSPSNSPYNTLPRRTTTRDVDYIRRSFATEWQAIGVTDAIERLQSCIQSTAQHFRLGADWMNSDADIALPMANDSSGKPYDPIYTASIQPNNVHLHTVFSSPNGMLTLVSVTPFWAVALKLVRYTKWDPGDICLLLRNGTNLSGTQWSPQMLETWLLQQCWPMGYGAYDWRKKGEMKARIAHAIQMVSHWNSVSASGNSTTVAADPATGGNDKAGWDNSNPSFVSPAPPHPPTTHVQQHSMGNGWSRPSTHAQHDVSSNSWTGPLPQPSHHRSKSHAPTSDPDEWELVPRARPRSYPIHGPSHSKQQQHQPQLHAEHFDRPITTMVYNDRGPVIPTGIFPKKSDTPETSSRRKRDKKRSSNLKSDRLSKLFRRGYNPADGESDSDDPDDGRNGSQRLHSLDLNRYLGPQNGQQVHRHTSPRPSAWHIYATAQPQTLARPHTEPRFHHSLSSGMAQVPEVVTHHRRHRPPPLDLDTESLSNSLGLLNFRQ